VNYWIDLQDNLIIRKDFMPAYIRCFRIGRLTESIFCAYLSKLFTQMNWKLIGVDFPYTVQGPYHAAEWFLLAKFVCLAMC
jgi:hypothetical protein